MAFPRPRNMLQWASAFLEETPLSSTPVPSSLVAGTINVAIRDFVTFGVDGTRRDDRLQTEPTPIARIIGIADHPHYGPILRLAWLFRDRELNDNNVTNALGRIYSDQCASNELLSSSVETYNHAAMVLNILPVVSFVSHTISLPVIDENTLSPEKTSLSPVQVPVTSFLW
ncbi:hypothetical protein BN946_scf184801.g1 [Trametes cinnabarina]|uniref:Uncharacterized protein n=1 Tax=Pycnoporus cinnabarinus TaxID=5643 RepID=A0A060S910_PYCCI|nr:hypothetical protein BN946_scf184801.g1 [Trametes cinnabarina]